MSMMNPVWRDRIWGTVSIFVAGALGLLVAQGEWLLPAMVAAAGILMVLIKLEARTPGNLILAGLLAGYVVGNRGFAHLMPIPGLPLLPGEAGLALVAAFLFIERASREERVSFWDPMGCFIAAWILIGCSRMVFDFRSFGITALRDFAMVYYAAFYFLARVIVLRPGNAARLLLGTVQWSALAMVPIYFWWRYSPELVFSLFSIGGIPLVFYKNDLVGLYAALGAGLHFLRFEETRRPGYLLWSLILVGTILATDNRASLVALIVFTAAVSLTGRWRMAAVFGVGGALAALAIVVVAHLQNRSWQETPVFEVYEAVASMTDPTGAREYQGEGTGSKGDNNLFRAVWWRLVIEDTWEQSPVFGLGFGYDLASEFEREYYAGIAGDFSARSPHNVFITVFARMGLVGLAGFMVVMGLLLRNTWRAARTDDLGALKAWAAAVAILASATFGVVLEGPMGAVVFWIMLGIASGLGQAEGPVDDLPALEDAQAQA